MDPVLVGYLGLVLMLVLIFCGIPLTYAMSAVGFVGILYIKDFNFGAMQEAMLAWEKGGDAVLMCIPLFILMGQLIYQTKIVSDLFSCIRTWVGHLPGGLAVAGVVACAMFGAVTGSAYAASATMGVTMMPELLKYKYDTRLSSGVIAASASLATIIPPSVAFIVYGILTETSIASMFIAGIGPGVLLALAFAAVIVIQCIHNPKAGPRGPVFSWKERFVSLTGMLPLLVLFLVVIGGIYGGVFTPTEAAGVGVTGVVIIALVMRRLTWAIFKAAAKESAMLATSIFFVILAGYLISRFLVITGTTKHIIDCTISVGMPPWMLALSMGALYLVMGSIMDSFGIAILTFPILFPIAMAAGFDAIWFGAFATVIIAVGLITPPVGMNIFILHSVVKDIPMKDMFIGVSWFALAHAIVTFLMIIFPGIATWLPMTMK